MIWICVKDRLPTEDGDYLAYYGLDESGEPIYGINGFAGGRWDTFARKTVTHWMDLPEPPKDALQAKQS